MKKRMINKVLFSVILVLCCIVLGCKLSSSNSDYENGRGNPILVIDKPVYDENSKTFSLTVHADSVSDAQVTYYLLDGDSILMQALDGHFTGIAPLEEGYNVKAKVEWSDTTITTMAYHVVGFIVPLKPIEKLSAKELKKLFDTKDKAGIEKCLSQNIKLVVKGSQMTPSMIDEVLLNLESHIWRSVEVMAMEYDEYNYITSITIKPIGEKVETVSNENESEMFYDEF